MLMTIPRWDEGLLDMCPGDKRKLTIPSELAYGSRAMGPIPADSTLGLISSLTIGALTDLDSLRDRAW